MRKDSLMTVSLTLDTKIQALIKSRECQRESPTNKVLLLLIP